jgi:hypothetical protein
MVRKVLNTGMKRKKTKTFILFVQSFMGGGLSRGRGGGGGGCRHFLDNCAVSVKDRMMVLGFCEIGGRGSRSCKDKNKLKKSKSLTVPVRRDYLLLRYSRII